MKKNKAFILGSYHCCYSFTAEQMPKSGETVMGYRFKMSGGAKGHGQMLACALAGTETSGIMRVGDDTYGHYCIDDFKRANIDCTYVRIDPDHATGAAGVMLNRVGENIIIVVPGANAAITEEDIDAAEPMIRECAVAGFQFENNFNAIEYCIKKADMMGVDTVVDPAPVVQFDDALYQHISYIKPNEREAELLTGIPVVDTESAAKAGELLLEKGVKKAAIITMGGAGVVLVTRDGWRAFPAAKVKVTDTTSAGDTFAGALVASLAQGMDVIDAVINANCIAAFCVKRGPQESIFDFFPTKEQLSTLKAEYLTQL